MNMISCAFPSGDTFHFRHVVLDAIVIKDDKLLLVKRPKNSWAGAGLWALAGGYAERGETLEQGVLREVQEETGYSGKVKALFKINADPKRDDVQNVQFVYIVEAGEVVSETDGEVEKSEWFNWDELPKDDEIAFDHATVISQYLAFLKQNYSLPIVV